MPQLIVLKGIPIPDTSSLAALQRSVWGLIANVQTILERNFLSYITSKRNLFDTQKNISIIKYLPLFTDWIRFWKLFPFYMRAKGSDRCERIANHYIWYENIFLSVKCLFNVCIHLEYERPVFKLKILGISFEQASHYTHVFQQFNITNCELASLMSFKLVN